MLWSIYPGLVRVSVLTTAVNEDVSVSRQLGVPIYTYIYVCAITT